MAAENRVSVPVAPARAESGAMPLAGRTWPRWLSLAVLLAGLAVTGALCTASRLNYLRNESRQVTAHAQLAADALAVVPIDVQRRLGRATTLASATGNAAMFAHALKGSVPKPFASVRLFRVVHGHPRLVTSLGKPALLRPASAQSRNVLARARSGDALALTHVATTGDQRLGYAVSVTTLGRTYVAYAEQRPPSGRHADPTASSPLADMNFAIYYGADQRPSALLTTDTGRLPISGTVGTATIPFGDRNLTLVISPRSSLLGLFAESVAWMILGAGTLFTALMALLTERLARRRAVAEQLAEVRGQLYQAQRGVAETLQTALLPHHLPTSPRLGLATRYLGGTEGIDVGGDWYDVISLSGSRTFFTVGDVSGRGLSAATMMSRLRHSIAAYAVEGHDPATVLAKVSGLIDLDRDGHFATAVCGIVDVTTGSVEIANAGHPPIVVVSDGTARPLEGPIGPPLGVGAQYDATELSLKPQTVLLAYTDGLVERRDASIDAGITQLCGAAGRARDLEEMLDTVLRTMLPRGASDDDTAILALQWTL